MSKGSFEQGALAFRQYVEERLPGLSMMSGYEKKNICDLIWNSCWLLTTIFGRKLPASKKRTWTMNLATEGIAGWTAEDWNRVAMAAPNDPEGPREKDIAQLTVVLAKRMKDLAA